MKIVGLSLPHILYDIAYAQTTLLLRDCGSVQPVPPYRSRTERHILLWDLELGAEQTCCHCSALLSVAAGLPQIGTQALA